MSSDKHREKNYPLKNHSNNRLDEFSPFRSFLNVGRATFKKHKIKIDVEYLKKVWETQKGICPYTGIKMILPRTSSHKNAKKSMMRASLDRIDSSKDYIVGNVEFVCQAINTAKNNYTKEDMKNFLRSIDFSVTHS